MNEEGGTPSSIAMYRAVLRRPSRGWWAVAALFAFAMLCGLLMYLADVARVVYFAHACAQVRDTWTGRECKPREVAPPPVQQYTFDFPPIYPAPSSDIPKPPPPVVDPGRSL